MSDKVLNPHYYLDKGISPRQVGKKWGLCFDLTNVLKYICRYKQKGGLEDLKKARVYLDLKIKDMEEEHGTD